MKLLKHLEMWLKPEPATQDWSARSLFEDRWIEHLHKAPCWGHLTEIPTVEGNEPLYVCSVCGDMEWDG